MSIEFSQKLYIDRKQYIPYMADLEFNVTFEEEVYLATCKHRDKGDNGGTLLAEAKTFADLQKAVIDTVVNYVADGYGASVGLSKIPSVAVSYEEELYPGSEGEAQIVAERNGLGYRTQQNGILDQSYFHENFEGLRKKIREAVQKVNPNGKKVTLVLDEVLQQ